MLRKIVRIDADKCNGCGQCVTACVEGAIQLVNGKAQLAADSYCDGLGACLGHCPMDAITVEEREAAEFDEKGAMAHAHASAVPHAPPPHAGHACPGTMARRMARPSSPLKKCGTGASPVRATAGGGCATPASAEDQDSPEAQSELTHWPVQLKLVAPNAPALQGADLLLAADCVPFALPDFHARFLRGKALLIGCPKLDDAQFYVEKLTQVLTQSDIRSLTVAHMEVPCCSGLTRIADEALERSGKQIPAHDVTISIEGKVLREE